MFPHDGVVFAEGEFACHGAGVFPGYIEVAGAGGTVHPHPFVGFFLCHLGSMGFSGGLGKGGNLAN